MKKTIILLALFLVNMSITAQKFGHFDYMEVLSAMPEFATVQSEMETLAKQYEDDLKRMQDEFQKKKGTLEQQKNLLPNIRQRQEQELQTLLQRIEQTYADSEQALQKANAEKMKPLADKIAVYIKVFLRLTRRVNARAAVARHGDSAAWSFVAADRQDHRVSRSLDAALFRVYIFYRFIRAELCYHCVGLDGNA